MYVGNGSTLNINSGKSIILSAGATATIDGTIANSGTFTNSNTALGYLIYNSTALYQQTQDSYTIPAFATWNTGSTFEMKGVVTGATGATSAFNQNYYNFIWNCTSQTINTNLTGNLTTINGNFTITSTGTTGSLRYTSSTSPTLTINGDLTIQNASQFNLNSSTGAPKIQLKGDLTISNGAKITSSGTGLASFYFIKTNGTQNFTSTATGINTNQISWHIGNGTVTNKLILQNDFIDNASSDIYVENNATLSCINKIISFGDTFNLKSGATLEIGSSAGITSSGTTGSIQTSGSHRYYNSLAKYTYAGNVNQVTGNGLPTSVNTLTIANTATSGVVTLSNTSVTPTTLNLNSGYFEIPTSKSVAMSTSATISANGGDFASNSAGNVNFAGSNSVSGNVSFYPKVNMNGSVDFGTGSAIYGTMNMNSGGSIANNHPPYYITGSLLKYNVSASRGDEWSTTINAGYPANVQIVNGVTFNLSGGAATTPQTCAGNLTIDNGSTLTMNASGDQMTVPFTINGDININGTLELSNLSGGDLNVKGNWTRANGATFTEHGRTVKFNGAAAQTITATGAATETFDAFEIDNTSAMTTANTGVLMASGTNLAINNSLVLTHGKLNVGTNELQILNTAANAISGYSNISSNPSSSSSFVVGAIRRKISTTATAYDFPMGTDANKYEVARINVTSNVDVDNLKATFNEFSPSGCSYSANIPSFPVPPPSNGGVHNSPITDMLNFGYYQVEPYDATNTLLTVPNYNIGYEAQMTFNGHSNGLVGSNAIGAVGYTIIKQPACGGQNWSLGNGTYNTTQQLANSTPSTSSAVTLKLSGLSSFSIFGGGFSPDEVLPIELVNFTVQQVADNALINWNTASEKNNDKFEIERSKDGITFEKIGEVKSKGSMANTYDFEDVSISHLNSNILYYRLRQVDFGGSFNYSPIRALVLNNDGKGFVINGYYPNPFNSAINIQLTATQAAEANYQLFDTKGTLILQSSAHINKGENILNIDGLSNLASGIYLLKVNSGNNSFNTTLQKQ